MSNEEQKISINAGTQQNPRQNSQHHVEKPHQKPQEKASERFAQGFQFRQEQPRKMGKNVVSQQKNNTSTGAWLDRVIIFSIMMLIVGVPLFFMGTTLQGIAFEKQAYFYFWTLLGTVAWVSKGVLTGNLHVKRTPLDVPIGIFLTVYIISAVVSINQWQSIAGTTGDPSRALTAIVGFILAYYLITTHVAKENIRWILGAFLTSSTITVLWTGLALMNIQFLPNSIASIAPVSLLGSMAGLATYLASTIIILMTVIFSLNKPETKKTTGSVVATIASVIVLILGLCDLLLLQSFVPWAGVIIGLSVFLIYILSRVVSTSGKWVVLPMAIFVVMIMLFLGKGNNFARIQLPVEVSPDFPLSWEVAKNSISENAFLGSGPGTFGYAFSQFRPESFNQSPFYDLRFHQGTGMFFEGVPTIGIIGIVAGGVLLFGYIGFAVVTLGRSGKSDKMMVLGFFSATLAVVSAGIQGRIEGPMVMYLMIIGAVSMVLLLEYSDNTSILKLSLKASPKYALSLAFIFIVVSAGVAYLFVYLGKSIMADVYAGTAVKSSEISIDGSVAKMVRAVEMNPKVPQYYTRLAQEYMVLANQEASKKEEERSIDALQTYMNNALAAANQAKNMVPNSVSAVQTLAQVYENMSFYSNDGIKLAKEQYERASELEPHNPIFPTKIGQLMLREAAQIKDEAQRKTAIEEAKKVLEQALAKKSNLAPAHYQLALAKEALGDTDGAFENLTNAVRADRANVTYIFNLARLYEVRGGEEDVKIAEKLYEQILSVNDSEVTTQLRLGLLLEKQNNRKDEAIAKFEKVIELLPEDAQEQKQRIEKMIDDVRNGRDVVVVSERQEQNILNQNDSQQDVVQEQLQETSESSQTELGAKEDSTNNQ